MTKPKLSNVKLSTLRNFLKSEGLNRIDKNKGRGGHEKWSSKKCTRPIIFQSHIDPVPEFIMIQISRHLNMSKKEMSEKLRNL